MVRLDLHMSHCLSLLKGGVYVGDDIGEYSRAY